MIRKRCGLAASLLLIATGIVHPAEQQFHRLADFELDSGQRLDCDVGYRTYGSMNATGSNVILFPTWFGGTTNGLEQFGKVGAGALANSDDYFVITIDALGNGVSCSPSNSELKVGEPPMVITTADMVRSQQRLLVEAFDIDRIHAVLGISMGGMQALRWLQLYPQSMNKLVVIDGTPKMTSYDLLHWTVYRDIVRSLQAEGASDETIGGVMARTTYLTLFTPDYFIETVAPDALDEFLAPSYSPNPAFRADDYVSQLDAMINHDILSDDFVDVVRRSEVDVLIVSTPSDQIVQQRPAQELAEKIDAEKLLLDSVCGHIGSSCEGEVVNDRVAMFLRNGKARS